MPSVTRPSCPANAPPASAAPPRAVPSLYRTITTLDTINTTLDEIGDLCDLIALVLESPEGEDITLTFPAARYLALQCTRASASLVQVQEDIKNATTPALVPSMDVLRQEFRDLTPEQQESLITVLKEFCSPPARQEG